MRWSDTPPVYDLRQKRRIVYSKQTRILYIESSIQIGIWQVVYITIVAACCAVFQGESKYAFSFALARPGAELWGFKVFQIFRGTPLEPVLPARSHLGGSSQAELAPKMCPLNCSSHLAWNQWSLWRQCRLHNFEKYTCCNYAKSYTVQ